MHIVFVFGDWIELKFPGQCGSTKQLLPKMLFGTTLLYLMALVTIGYFLAGKYNTVYTLQFIVF